MTLRRSRSFLFAATLLMVFAGCHPPETVARFCGAADGVLAASSPVFADLGGSCQRVKGLQQGIGSFALPAPDPGCAAIEKQARGAIAAATLLAEYMRALDALASFGTAKPETDAANLGPQAAAVAGTPPEAQAALGVLGVFLTRTAAGNYQSRSLRKDLVAANGSVAAVLNALITIVQTNYLDQELRDEESQLAVSYKDYAQNHPSAEVLVVLDTRWRTEQQQLEARRTSAKALVAALQEMEAGFADLSAHVSGLNSKQVTARLEPYAAQLQSMVPLIQKGF